MTYIGAEAASDESFRKCTGRQGQSDLEVAARCRNMASSRVLVRAWRTRDPEARSRTLRFHPSAEGAAPGVRGDPVLLQSHAQLSPCATPTITCRAAGAAHLWTLGSAAADHAEEWAEPRWVRWPAIRTHLVDAVLRKRVKDSDASWLHFDRAGLSDPAWGKPCSGTRRWRYAHQRMTSMGAVARASVDPVASDEERGHLGSEQRWGERRENASPADPAAWHRYDSLASEYDRHLGPTCGFVGSLAPL